MSAEAGPKIIKNNLLFSVDATNIKFNPMDTYTLTNNNVVIDPNGYFTFNGSNYFFINGTNLNTSSFNVPYSGKTIEIAFWMDPVGFTYSGVPFHRALLGTNESVEKRSFNTYIFTSGNNLYSLHLSAGNGIINAGVTNSIPVNTSTWYILTVTVSPTGVTNAYLNNSLVYTVTNAVLAGQYNIAQQFLGAADNNWYGRISFCRIYSRELTALEIALNYEASRIRFGL